ncbi:MAG: hypothetical protein FJ360_00330 [Thaumarchaeota archaeon]|nr:hypothetical protein [Nitrososphaerota archaeon]
MGIFSEDISLIIQLVIAIAGVSGVAGLFWGIYEYRENQKTKRKDTLFKLVHDFDISKEMHFAKKILDGFVYNFPENADVLGPNYFSKDNLKKILRSHESSMITDPKEIELRDSFSALFDFFDKLGYLYSNKIIKKRELQYFNYYIERARKSLGVLEFVKNYDYRWHNEIPK